MCKTDYYEILVAYTDRIEWCVYVCEGNNVDRFCDQYYESDFDHL